MGQSSPSPAEMDPAHSVRGSPSCVVRLSDQRESIPLARVCQVLGPTMPSTVTDGMSADAEMERFMDFLATIKASAEETGGRVAVKSYL
jgi:hypothetical protein